jgi:hypothetical protein
VPLRIFLEIAALLFWNWPYLKMEDRSQILLVARALVDKGEKKGKYF